MMMDRRFLALPCNQCLYNYTTETLSESEHNYNSYSIFYTYFITIVRMNISRRAHLWELRRTLLLSVHELSPY
jgi:hypothetical protein